MGVSVLASQLPPAGLARCLAQRRAIVGKGSLAHVLEQGECSVG